MFLEIVIVCFVIWCIIELSFRYFTGKEIINNSNNKKINNRKHIEKTFSVISNLHNYDMKKFLEGFFLGCSYEEIKRENIFSFLSWALFEKNYSSIQNNKKYMKDLQEVLEIIETRLDYQFENGYNDRISHVSMSLQKVRYWRHFLVLHLIYRLIDCVIKRGFDSKRLIKKYSGQFSYFHRDVDNKKRPIIFLHGISPGWVTYKNIINKIETDRPLILFNLDSYKISSFDYAKPSPEKVANAVQTILKKHNYHECDIISHSFGTIVAGWLIKKQININSIVFVDPVCFLLSLPDVASNFIYTEPKTMFHRVIRWFAAKDRTIAESLFRNFYWGDNILWLEDIPSETKITVYISNADEIIPYESIKQYMEDNNVEVRLLSKFSHAQAISHSDVHIDSILSKVKV